MCILCSDAQPSSPMVGRAAAAPAQPGFSPPSQFVSGSGFGIRSPRYLASGLVEAGKTFAPPVTENSWQEQDWLHI